MFEMSPQQIGFFDTFGFVAFPGLISDRIGQVMDDFEAVWELHGGGHDGHPHDGKQRSCIVPFIDQNERLCTLLDDSRILGIARALLGVDFNYMGSDGNYYVGDTQWHSDGWHPDLTHIKLAIYLDPLNKSNGCLRVIPGSHRIRDSYAEALQESCRTSMDAWGVAGKEVPCVALETRPGDVLCFNHNTKHAAFGGGSRRRMFTMNLCQRYPVHRLEDLRSYISGHARFWIERNYGEIMMRTANPERQRHLEQVMENDGHLAALARQMREKMPEPSRG